jgi:hypothetical protein
MLGASGATIGILNGIVPAMIALGNTPGAWAARRFRLKPVIVAELCLAASCTASPARCRLPSSSRWPRTARGAARLVAAAPRIGAGWVWTRSRAGETLKA